MQMRHYGATYEDYLSDEPDSWGLPDGLTEEQYYALPVTFIYIY